MSEDRFHRDDPLRTDPIRNFYTTLRSEAWGGGAGPADAPDWRREDPAADAGTAAGFAEGPIGRDFVLRILRLSNEVLRDQVQRGQDYTEQVATELSGSAADLRQLLERMLRSSSGLYVDSSLLWLDLLFLGRVSTITLPGQKPGTPPQAIPTAELRKVWEGLLRSSSSLYVNSMLLWLDLLFPKRPENPSLKPTAPVPVTVLSARPTHCTLSLNPGAETQPLEACQLWSRDTTKPPLMDVGFKTGADGKPFLRVRVPDDQPADIYLGVVCNPATGEPLGTLRVEVRQQA